MLKRACWITDAIGAATELKVEVRELVTRHVVTLIQIQRWLDAATRSQNERVQKDRLRALLKEAATPPRAGRQT